MSSLWVQASIAASFLLVAAYFWLRRPLPEPPPGVKITHDSWFGYNYLFLDQPALLSTGYVTQRAAIRAAWQEHERMLGYR